MSAGEKHTEGRPLSTVEAAAALDGCEYRSEMSREFEAMLKASGLVALFGGSDDLMEFRGAIHDEVGCCGGGVAHLTSEGLLQNECDNGECPHFERLQSAAAFIEAVWDDGGFSWRYDTAIPHSKFIVKEDGDNYCEGIVFAMDDVAAALTSATGSHA